MMLDQKRSNLPSWHKLATGYAEYLEGTKIKFHWDTCDHTQVVDYSKKPLHKRMSESACQMMSRWWSRERGGCIVGSCKRCEKRKP